MAWCTYTDLDRVGKHSFMEWSGTCWNGSWCNSRGLPRKLLKATLPSTLTKRKKWRGCWVSWPNGEPRVLRESQNSLRIAQANAYSADSGLARHSAGRVPRLYGASARGAFLQQPACRATGRD